MALKRKIEKESTNSGKGPKAFKVIETKTKPLTKNELMVKYKALEEKLENLVKENERNIQEIARLEKEKFPKISKDQESQTKNDTDFVEISCTECIFLASCEDELNWHMGEDHGKDYISYFDSDYPCSVCDRWCKFEKDLNRHMKVYHAKRVKFFSFECNMCDESLGNKDELMKHNEIEHTESMNISQSEQINTGDSLVSCSLCDDKFKTRRSLMVHKKREHTEKVAICWNFSTGNCEFGDENCWFLHTGRSEYKFECTSCDKKFANKDKFLHHRKNQHKESVQNCRNMVSDTCKYGNEKCWFNHGDSIDTTEDENNKKVNEEVIEKIFQMMEKFTQQIVEIKEINNLK